MILSRTFQLVLRGTLFIVGFPSNSLLFLQTSKMEFLLYFGLLPGLNILLTILIRFLGSLNSPESIPTLLTKHFRTICEGLRAILR